MTDTTTPTPPASPATDDVKKRRRERVDQLLARPAVTSEGQVTLAGKLMPYAVTLDFLPVIGPAFADSGGEPEAAIYTTAYVLKDAEPSQRPICFAFNGGPGSASVWLHPGRARP